MVTLGALAAGTAHELGTPLASLAVITDEITDGLDPKKNAEQFEYQAILRQQIARCKEILSVLSESAGERRAESGHKLKPAEFIEQLLDYWQQQRENPQFTRNLDSSLQTSAMLIYDRTVQQSIINLLNNAAEASEEPIIISASCEPTRLQINITDRGAGLSTEQLQLAGQSAFTSKPDGMGIGLFLALNSIQRTGGSVNFSAASPRGTITRISLPLIEEDTHE